MLGGSQDKRPLVIRNDSEMAAALDRAGRLAERADHGGDDCELAEIRNAIQVYNDAMRMLKHVADRGRQTTEPPVAAPDDGLA